MNNGRIRHATETFVNNLIDAVKKLIESNTKQIEVLSREALKYIGNITTFSEVSETGYYIIAGCLDGTIPIQYGTLKAYLSGSEKTIEATGFKNNEPIQCYASYNNNTKQWIWKQCSATEELNVLSKHFYWSFEEIGEGITQDTPIEEIIASMRNDSILSATVYVPTTPQWETQHATVLIQRELGNRATVILTTYDGELYYGVQMNVWSGLIKVSTTKKTDISVPYGSEYMDGLIANYTSRIVKNSMGECTAYISVKLKDGTPLQPNNVYIIAAVPVGFTPKYGAIGVSTPYGTQITGLAYTDTQYIGVTTPVATNILLATLRWECEV
jgi:hypothetical protein